MPASGRDPVAPADAARGAGGLRLSAPTRDLVQRAVESPSRPLVPAERADLDGRTGHDLGRIRIHDSPESATAASALDAAAWSFGPRIGFARPAQAPGPVRSRLLRHEAAHVSDYLSAPDSGTADGRAPAWLADAEGPHEEAARRSAAGTGLTEGAPASAMGPGVVHRAPAGSGATQAAPAEQSEVDVLAPEEQLRWIGSPSSPALAIRPSWLAEQGVPRDTPVIDGDEYPEVMRPIVEALVAYCTWADRERALANVGETKLQLDPVSWKRDQTIIPVASSIYTVIGLPKDAPVQLVHQGDGVRVWVDLVWLAEPSPAPGADVAGGDIIAGKAVADAIIAALEAEYGRPVAPHLRPTLADYFEKDVPPTPEVYSEEVPGKTLGDLFGEAAYREVTEKNAGTTGQTGLVVNTRQGRTVAVDPSVSVEEIAVIRTMLDAARLQPTPPAPPTVEGEKPKPPPPPLLSRADVDALIALSKAKDKDAVLAALRKGGGAPDDRALVADLIEAARAQLEWQAAAKSLDTSFDQGERERPIIPRPVRGVIRNPDRLVPGLEAHFTFETRDQVDAFRVPLVKIHWYARKAPGPGGQPGPVIEDDVTDYVEVSEHGVLNERIFEVTFPEKGIYEIHAFVDHNFFLPAHVTTQVEVTTEDAILAEFRTAGEPAWGAETSSKKHEFAEIGDDEQLLTSIVLGPLAGAAIDTGYAEGTQAEGRLDPEVAARSATAGADRIAELTAERDRLDTLAADYRAQGMRDDDVVLTAIKDRRDRVADAISDLEKLPTTGAGSAHVVPTRGFYASRTHGIPSAPLALVAYFTVSGKGTDTTYHGHLLDQSELLESTHFHLERTADSFEGVMEALFVELSQVYPNGSVSFSFQVWDAAAQTFSDRFVRFERVTDTVLQDVHDVAFSNTVSMLVNLGALLLTLFPPTMVIGVTLGLAYNAAQTIDDIRTNVRRGTLSSERVAVQLLQLGLDIVPMVGKATKLVTIGTRTYRVIEAAQYAGMAFLISDDAENQIRTLRDGQITDVLRLRAEIEAISAVNAADPKLSELRQTEQDALIGMRLAASDTWTNLISSQAIMLGSMAVIRHVAEPVLAGGKRPDLGEPQNRRNESGDEGETGKKKTSASDDEGKPARQDSETEQPPDTKQTPDSERPPDTEQSPDSEQAPETKKPADSEQAPETVAPPETTAPPEAGLPPESTAPPETTAPPEPVPKPARATTRKRKPPATAPQQPFGKGLGRLQRHALDMIGKLSKRDRQRILEWLNGLPQDKAREQLSTLGRFKNVKALRKVIDEMRLAALPQDPDEGPAQPASGLDESKPRHFDEEDPMREFQKIPPPDVSPAEAGVERSELKDRMLAAGVGPTFTTKKTLWNPHHLIPVSLERHPVLETLRSNLRWDNNAPKNGYALPTKLGIPNAQDLPVHQVSRAYYDQLNAQRQNQKPPLPPLPIPDAQTMRDLQGHPNWNKKVRERLDALRPFMNQPDVLLIKVEDLILELRHDIDTSVANGQLVLL